MGTTAACARGRHWLGWKRSHVRWTACRAFVRGVWSQVKAGVAISEIARAVGCDDYRAITLIAHWVEEGALLPEPDEGA